MQFRYAALRERGESKGVGAGDAARSRARCLAHLCGATAVPEVLPSRQAIQRGHGPEALTQGQRARARHRPSGTYVF